MNPNPDKIKWKVILEMRSRSLDDSEWSLLGMLLAEEWTGGTAAHARDPLEVDRLRKKIDDEVTRRKNDGLKEE